MRPGGFGFSVSTFTLTPTPSHSFRPWALSMPPGAGFQDCGSSGTHSQPLKFPVGNLGARWHPRPPCGVCEGRTWRRGLGRVGRGKVGWLGKGAGPVRGNGCGLRVWPEFRLGAWAREAGLGKRLRSGGGAGLHVLSPKCSYSRLRQTHP